MKLPSDQIEDIYPLSPMQQGMFFHTLYGPVSGVYIKQRCYLLRGALDISVFTRAWQQLVNRHSILRSAFFWDDLDEPVQVVYRHVDLPILQDDWRALPATEQEAQLETYCMAERRRGLNLAAVPLMRLALIRVAEDAHYFVWTYHHLLLDGWCNALILGELITLYTAISQGRRAQLAPAQPYRDYIAWLKHQDITRAEAFWRQTLSGFRAPTAIATKPPTHSQPDDAPDNALEQLQLSRTATTALRSMARQHQLTLNTLVQGAWALLLGAYSGQDDVVFGIAVAGRPADLPGSESSVGLFVNTLPARVRLDPQAELIGWLNQLQNQQVEARQYEYTPLIRIHSWSEVARGVPLFESVLAFENYPAPVAAAGSGGMLTIEYLRSIEKTNLPLNVVVMPGAELLVELWYDRQRFDSATVRRMLDLFEALLEHMAARPRCRLADLPTVGATEREQLLLGWNDTAQPTPVGGCLHQLVEAQAERTPEAIAVIFDHRPPTTDHMSSILNSQFSILNSQFSYVTYAELNKRANQLAQELRRRGVSPETMVGICIERSIEMVVGILGILKAGGAFVPLDPSYPPERLAFMLRDAQATVLLTSQEQRTENKEQRTTERKGVLHTPPADDVRAYSTTPPADPGQPTVLDLIADWDDIAQQPETNLDSAVTPANLAYVIYTSGSTGTPKGVMITHQGICNTIGWKTGFYQMTERDSLLQNFPFAFDPSIGQLFGPLTVGARLILSQPGGQQDIAYLLDQIGKHQIPVFDCTPSVLQMLLDQEDLTACASLRAVFCGGEALPIELQARFAQRLGAQLHNCYGPTECSIDSTCWTCTPDSAGPITPIGRPIANTQIYLLDQWLRPVPIGVPGEIAIGGLGLARGYLGRPDLTAERFVPNPFPTTDDPFDTAQGRRRPTTDPFDTVTRRQGDKVTEAGDALTPSPLHPFTLSESPMVSGQWSVVGGRLYRTGDLARYRPDGTIEFLGRADQQVKIRGHRIELGEVERNLLDHPDIHEAAVVAREDTPGDQRLVAYIVPDQEQRTKPVLSEVEGNKEQKSEKEDSQFSILNSQFSGELRAFLKQRLPGYMLPSAFVGLDALPRLPSGKVDRRALPRPDQGRPEQQAAFVAPRGPIEEALAELWAAVLQIDRVGSADDFFELGGHSLLATRLIARIRDAFDIQLPLRSLFENPKLSDLAQAIMRQQIEQAGQADIALLLDQLQSMSEEQARQLIE